MYFDETLKSLFGVTKEKEDDYNMIVRWSIAFGTLAVITSIAINMFL